VLSILYQSTLRKIVCARGGGVPISSFCSRPAGRLPQGATKMKHQRGERGVNLRVVTTAEGCCSAKFPRGRGKDILLPQRNAGILHHSKTFLHAAYEHPSGVSSKEKRWHHSITVQPAFSQKKGTAGESCHTQS